MQPVSISSHFRQEPGAAVQYVPACFIKVTGVPWVGHLLPGSVRVIQEETDLAQRVSAGDPAYVPKVCPVHADDIVVPGVIPSGDLPGTMSGTVDPVPSQHPPGGRIDQISNLLPAGGR